MSYFHVYYLCVYAGFGCCVLWLAVYFVVWSVCAVCLVCSVVVPLMFVVVVYCVCDVYFDRLFFVT